MPLMMMILVTYIIGRPYQNKYIYIYKNKFSLISCVTFIDLASFTDFAWLTVLFFEYVALHQRINESLHFEGKIKPYKFLKMGNTSARNFENVSPTEAATYR